MMLKYFFLHFFPFTCPSCKNESVDNLSDLCQFCYSRLKFISQPYCRSCGGNNNTIFELCSTCMKEKKHSWQSAISIFEMKGLSRELIINYKYYKDTSIVRFFSEQCCKKIIESGLNVDIITYIPLHWIKYFKRGFNQSFLLADFISRKLDITRSTLLRRTKYTKSQTQLTTEKRRENIIGIFKAVNIPDICGKDILLIDDVYTTGSTLHEASNILLNAGAKTIFILTLARK
jgi:competence protein ComFC